VDLYPQLSKRLFGIAKRGVEMVIETDEATALAWMGNGGNIWTRGEKIC